MKQSTVVSIVGALICAFAIWQSAGVGLARTDSQRAERFNDVAAADKAVRLSPNDAEVHSARGSVLQRLEDYPEACRELERAIQLRPHDYFLWMLLGVTRDLNDDQEGGRLALQQSVVLAPSYAKTHWLFGNLLLRMNQTDEAFAELRFAADRDFSLLPNVIDLAWSVYRHDATQTIAAMQPQSDNARMALAMFFAAHSQGAPALAQFHLASLPIADADRLIQALLSSRLFSEAYEVWVETYCKSCKPGTLLNASFENDIDLQEHGFGWQISSGPPNVTLSIDPDQHYDGVKSLRIDFHGPSDAATSLASQFLIVKPETRYRLTFQAMSKSFVSAAAPSVSLIELSDEKSLVIGQSSSFVDGNTWRPVAIDFTTRANTQAVRLVVSRQSCPNNPCAAFGTVWLDSFALGVVANVVQN